MLRVFTAGEELAKASRLDDKQLAGIESIAMDMHQPYIQSTLHYVPEAEGKIAFDKIISAVGADQIVNLRSTPKLAVAIDAPLAFPNKFRNLLSGKALVQTVPVTEIENRLAYRDCERWVEKQFGKKPLSATFDKLGNNASLAILALVFLGGGSRLGLPDVVQFPDGADPEEGWIFTLPPDFMKHKPADNLGDTP